MFLMDSSSIETLGSNFYQIRTQIFISPLQSPALFQHEQDQISLMPFYNMFHTELYEQKFQGKCLPKCTPCPTGNAGRGHVTKLLRFDWSKSGSWFPENHMTMSECRRVCAREVNFAEFSNFTIICRMLRIPRVNHFVQNISQIILVYFLRDDIGNVK